MWGIIIYLHIQTHTSLVHVTISRFPIPSKLDWDLSDLYEIFEEFKVSICQLIDILSPCAHLLVISYELVWQGHCDNGKHMPCREPLKQAKTNLSLRGSISL